MGPQVPDVGTTRLIAEEGKAAAIGRPAGHRREAVAGDAADVGAVGAGDVDAADAVAIRVEGDGPAVGRQPHVVVLRLVVGNRRDVQDAVLAALGALERAARRGLGMKEDGRAA